MTPLEHAARALAQTRYGYDAWEQEDADGRQRLLAEARAVIEAIREPSEAMTKAGRDSLEHDSDGSLLGGPEEAAHNTYSRMIDALLEEGQ